MPIGPNNHFEPGTADMGQPTHFLTRRRFGMFTVTMPKEFPKTQKITWTLTANGVTNDDAVLHAHRLQRHAVQVVGGESRTREFNTPPVLRFAEHGPNVPGTSGDVAKALSRTATVGTPMPLEMWADDDALYSTGGNAPMTQPASTRERAVAKYRGPGKSRSPT